MVSYFFFSPRPNQRKQTNTTKTFTRKQITHLNAVGLFDGKALSVLLGQDLHLLLPSTAVLLFLTFLLILFLIFFWATWSAISSPGTALVVAPIGCWLVCGWFGHVSNGTLNPGAQDGANGDRCVESSAFSFGSRRGRQKGRGLLALNGSWWGFEGEMCWISKSEAEFLLIDALNPLLSIVVAVFGSCGSVAADQKEEDFWRLMVAAGALKREE